MNNQEIAKMKLMEIAYKHLHKCDMCKETFSDIIMHSQNDDELLQMLHEVALSGDLGEPYIPNKEDNKIAEEQIKEYEERFKKEKQHK